MRPSRFLVRTLVDQPKDKVFGWYLQEGSFPRAFPSWEGVRVVGGEELPGHQFRFVCDLSKKRYVFRSIKWRSQARALLKMEKGGLQNFDYEVEIRDHRNEGSEITEKIEYLFRLPWLFPDLRRRKFEHRIKRLLSYTQEILLQDLTFFKRYPVSKPLKILVSGSQGLIGSNLKNLLLSAGHEVWYLVRSKKDLAMPNSVLFDVKTGEVEREKLEGFDAFIYLSGESINARWTNKTKQELIASRVVGTKTLAKIILSLNDPPKVFLSASGVGYYGDKGGSIVNEGDSKGQGFLADLCESWEGASHLLTTFGIRVAHLRFGAVLSSSKGVLQRLLTPFRYGLGGIFGSGEQYMSWISIDDAVRSIYHVLMTEGLKGPVNVTSPESITNRDFSRILAKHLHRHLGPPIPRALLRFFKGQMADEVLLSSIRAEPKKLLDSGYRFFYPTLEMALPHLVR